MRSISMLFVAFIVACSVSACGGKTDPEHPTKWSDPEPVLEGCESMMHNTKQCQSNPGTQQLMIKIENK